MVRKCAVFKCGSSVGPLFRVPRNEEISDKWRKYLSLENEVTSDEVPNSFLLCREHFDPSDIRSVRLRPRSVPVKYSKLNPALAATSSAKETEYSSIVEINVDDKETEFSSTVEINVYEEVNSTALEIPLLENKAANNISFCEVNETEFSAIVEIDMNVAIQSTSCEQECVENNAPRHLSPPREIHCDDSVNVDGFNSSMECSNEQHQVKKRKCAVVNCNISDQPLHSFPAIMIDGHIDDDSLERCRIWVKRAGNKHLLNIPTAMLHKRYFICHTHFSDDQFFNLTRKKLISKAIPIASPEIELCEDDMKAFPLYRAQDVIFQDENFDNFQKQFEKIMGSLTWRTCQNCKESFVVKASSTVKCLHSKACKLYSEANDMDPGDVPPELQGLTYIEELLIARVHPIVSVYKLKGHQFGYKGNVINFPQNVKEFAKQLPHSLQNLTSILTVRTGESDVNHVDFHVRHDKVKNALLWLKNHNHFYSDIELSEDNLAALPVDGYVYDIFGVNDVMTDNDTGNDDSENDLHCNIDGNIIYESCIPMLGQPSEDDHMNKILNWPSLENNPINEFSTVGYVASAFPCLFPRGIADLRTPRSQNITETNYFKHLMRYYDRRFAQHPRFRFFAYNSLIRWRALSNVRTFVKRNEEVGNMSAEDLRNKLKEDPGFIKKLMFQNNNIPGSRPYWFARGKELLSMAQQIGLPTLFFTLSCADFHWPELFQLLCPDRNVDDITEKERRQLIEDNPMVVDEFFHVRVKTYITEVLQRKYKINDIWYRTEYQHRGSAHIHGVLWLADAPDVTKLIEASEEEREKVAAYFDNLVTAFNPSDGHHRVGVHPCRKRMSDVNDMQEDLSHLLNHVQRHTKCVEGYCLRKNRTTQKLECRFKFPIEENQEKGRIVITPDNDVEFLPRRNDPRLNKYNPYIIQSWRANIDVSPVISTRALVNYLTKYIAKGECQSKQFDVILKNLVDNARDDSTAQNVLRRLFIQVCCDRDYCAQEVCHSLMGQNLFSAGGRKFVSISFKNEDDWIEIEQSEARRGKSFIKKYQERHTSMNNLCLWQTAKNYNLPSNTKNKKPAIVQIYPQFKYYEGHPDKNEQFYRQQVLLFVPWRNEADMINEGETWESVHRKHINTIEKNKEEDLVQLESIQPSEDDLEPAMPQDYMVHEQWMFASQMGPHNVPQKIELGRRDIDLQYDWHCSSNDYEQYGGIPRLETFLTEQKSSFLNNNEEDDCFVPDVTFTSEQNAVLNVLEMQISQLKNENKTNDFYVPRKVLVQGRAGTGKSLLIAAMKRKIFKEMGNKAALFLGPTGVCSLNINGETIHSALQIDLNKKQQPLTGHDLHSFKDRMKDVKIIIIDEYSMVGCKLTHRIDQRLKEASQCYDTDFGNYIVYYFGDIKQLNPPFDSPAYSDSQTSYEAIMGKLIYESFDCCFVLTQIMRQSDGAFKDTLNNISVGTVIENDYSLLKRRFTTSLTLTERQTFDDAMHLFPTNIEVHKFNEEKLSNLKDPVTHNPVPVARLAANHNCDDAAKDDSEESEGLPKVIYVAKGAKIMLRSNLWTRQGLVNGSVGKVIDIVFNENSDPQKNLPAVLICQFDSYKGPYLDSDKKTVPIAPITKFWTGRNGKAYSRTNFPISLSYACTVHKSQGLTLDKVVVDIQGSRPRKNRAEMSPGLTYVALSRARSLEGLLLQPFPFSVLENLNSRPYIIKRRQWEDILATKIFSLHQSQ